MCTYIYIYTYIHTYIHNIYIHIFVYIYNLSPLLLLLSSLPIPASAFRVSTWGEFRQAPRQPSVTTIPHKCLTHICV